MKKASLQPLLMLAGAAAGAAIAYQTFTFLERAGWRVFWDLGLGFKESLKWVFTSSGAIKMWAGAGAGALVGWLIGGR